MNEEDMLAAIRTHVRDDRRDDDAFERVARGEAAEDEVRPELEGARPLGPDAVDRIVARVTKSAPPAASSKPARVVPLRQRLAPWAAPLALAAGFVLFLTIRGVSDSTGGGAVLPGYTVAATGQQAQRGAPPGNGSADRLRIGRAPGARFEIVARPETSASDAKIVAYAFTMPEAAPLDADVAISRDGAVRIVGDARALAGANEIRVVVATPESVGSFEGALAHAKSGAGDSRLRVLRIPIDRE